MNLTNLSDEKLLSQTESLVRHEREVLTDVLHHLREIERRRLYSALKYNSLFAYAVTKLGYSRDQAYRRIAAMKLMKEMPEVEEKITSGKISLTNLGVAQNFFNKEAKATQTPFTKDEKLEVLNQLEAKSSREAEKMVASLSSSPEVLKSDKIKDISKDKIELRFTANQEMQIKIDKLKGMLANKAPHITLGELFDRLCDLGMQTWDPAAKHLNSKTSKAKLDLDKSGVAIINMKLTAVAENSIQDATPDSAIQKPLSHAKIKQMVWSRDKSRCTNCQSQHGLELDHIHPRAKGGPTSIENLRLLCRSCNQRSAINEYGQLKMDMYLN